MKLCNAMRNSLLAIGLSLTGLPAQAALLPVLEYQFPGSNNGTGSAVIDLSGAAHNATASAGSLSLSNNVPVGAPSGTQSVNFVASPGRITTTNFDLLTSTNAAAAGGYTYDIWFNPTGNNSGGGFRKILDNAGTEYLAYSTGPAGTTPTITVGLGNGAVGTVTGAVIDPSGWNHLVFEFDTRKSAMSGTSVTGIATLIVNDVVQWMGNSRTLTNFGDSLNRPIAIAQHPLGGEQFSGLVYNPAVSLGVDSRLLGHWKLNETTGTTTADASGYGFTGNISGATLGAPATQGVGFGTAFNFDGVNDQVSLGTVTAFERPNDFTVMAWIKPDRVTGSQRIFSQDAPAGFGFGLTGDELRFTTYGVLDYDTTGVDIQADIFQHVAVVFTTGNDALFYVNGELVSTINGVSPVTASSLGFFIGSQGGSEFFDGVIDDVRYYRGSLTQAEIAAIIAIPEPASIMLNGLAGASCLKRRRRHMA